jgi:anti-sigma-K factor RskA
MAVDDIHSLAAAYALHALDPADEQRFEAHLEGCDQCRVDVSGYLESATALAAAVEPADPPAELRERILRQARTERPNVVPLRPRRFAVQTTVAAVVAAVAACAAIGIGLWANSLSNKLDNERQAARARAAALSVLANPAARRVAVAGHNATVAVSPSGTAALVASELGRAPSGKTYEVWVIEGKTPKRAGLLGGGRENAIKLERPVPKGAVVAVTVERKGGVDSPTGTPLFFTKV